MRSSTSSPPRRDVWTAADTDTLGLLDSRPDLVSQDSSKFTVKSIDSCMTVFSEKKAPFNRNRNASQCCPPPLWTPPTRSNIEILAEIEEMVASFQFEGLEQVMIRNPIGDGDISELSSLDGFSVPDSLCAQYLTKGAFRGDCFDVTADAHQEDHTKQSRIGDETNLDTALRSNRPTQNPMQLQPRLVSLDSGDDNASFDTCTLQQLHITA
jgi:hypothetical protein